MITLATILAVTGTAFAVSVPLGGTRAGYAALGCFVLAYVFLKLDTRK